MLSDFVVSLVRTGVPLGVGWLIGVGLLPQSASDTATITFTALITAGYYLLVRLLEQLWPKFGWLLGSPRKPAYPGR